MEAVSAAEREAMGTLRVRPGTSVLLGEPDGRTADLVGHRLGRLGCEVVHVEDGTEVLARAAQQPFAAIVINLRMPGVPGLELLKRLRRCDRQIDTPVVMLSSTNNEQDLERAFALGAVDYIPKPFSLKEFVVRVVRFLELEQPVEALGAEEVG